MQQSQQQQLPYRNIISDDHPIYKPEANRYHLYIVNSCPFAHRAYIALKLKGLEGIIGLSITEPVFDDELGWQFSESYPDHVNGFSSIPDLYKKSGNPEYTGRFTVPLLWDKQSSTIVNNESPDLLRILNNSFNQFVNSETSPIDLYPSDLQLEINELNGKIAEHINSGVYKVGAAKTQEIYNTNVDNLFKTFNELEERLEKSGSKYLFGDRLTETDIRLFTTLIRFDIVYYHVMKCNLKQIQQYTYLKKYLVNLYQIPTFRSTVDFNEIKTGDYKAKVFNPSGIIPIGPNIDYLLQL
ncbi:hypothetical protein PPL_06819 [Heterostelium album PN500]|uniref:GST C-terminal domain-containing protein n=1 Tax=Heterostelium pallidum (strain ATCC 26659 / Pp 5 / PN500) TaxID=670386 RepID=D3BDL7_HETP5|nr:hypothetical protein PPL_06819 [Heterostelium album PN500]EFA79998.1 hypothetical protein PPL_06819 [Heterostelium album PN500]|eukprot:XP_020432118.1 hypothetical protein PPL_06819 [Heterostelium album PN500]